MKPSLLYRIAAVLLVLFAAGHQVGFRRVDPAWNAAAVVHAMQSARFAVQGYERTYWDFFSGFGFFVTVLLLFSAVLAWEFGRMPEETLRELGRARWAFALAYVTIAIITWLHFFLAPDLFATVIAIGLIAAAAAGKRTSRPLPNV